MINRLYIPFYSHQKYINCSCNDFGIRPESCEPDFYFFLSLRGKGTSQSQAHGQDVCFLYFYFFFFKRSSNGLFAAHQGGFCFKKCISYLCFPSSQLASICCRLGLANSSAMSRRLEKLAANKSPNPSCFPCLEWWTTLPLIYEMIWEVCVCMCVCVHECVCVCVCVSVKWRKCAWERRHVLVSAFYIGYLFLCAGMLWCEC